MTEYSQFEKSNPSASGYAVGAKGSEVDVNVDEFILSGVITDISSAGSNWVTTPWACTVEGIATVIDADITSGGAAAITFEIGGTAVTGSAISIALSSTAGTVDSSTPTALNTLAADGALELITDGGSTNASKAEVTIRCKRT